MYIDHTEDLRSRNACVAQRLLYPSISTSDRNPLISSFWHKPRIENITPTTIGPFHSPHPLQETPSIRNLPARPIPNRIPIPRLKARIALKKPVPNSTPRCIAPARQTRSNGLELRGIARKPCSRAFFGHCWQQAIGSSAMAISSVVVVGWNWPVE